MKRKILYEYIGLIFTKDVNIVKFILINLRKYRFKIDMSQYN